MKLEQKVIIVNHDHRTLVGRIGVVKYIANANGLGGITLKLTDGMDYGGYGTGDTVRTFIKDVMVAD